MATRLHDALVAPEIATAAVESRSGLDVLKVMIAGRSDGAVEGKTGRGWPFFFFGFQTDGAQDYYYRQLSYYLFFSIHHTTQTNRLSHTQTHTTPTTWGAFWSEEGGGLGNAHIF